MIGILLEPIAREAPRESGFESELRVTSSPTLPVDEEKGLAVVDADGDASSRSEISPLELLPPREEGTSLGVSVVVVETINRSEL